MPIYWTGDGDKNMNRRIEYQTADQALSRTIGAILIGLVVGTVLGLLLVL